MIKLFINSYGAYNEGKVGDWYTLEDIANEIVTVEELQEKHGVELFIQDYNHGYDTELGLTEYFNLEQLEDLYYALVKYEYKALSIIEIEGLDYIKEIDSYDYYEDMTLEEVAEEFVSEMGLPDFALRYFDYEKLVRDLQCDGYTKTTYGVLVR